MRANEGEIVNVRNLKYLILKPQDIISTSLMNASQNKVILIHLLLQLTELDASLGPYSSSILFCCLKYLTNMQWFIPSCQFFFSMFAN